MVRSDDSHENQRPGRLDDIDGQVEVCFYTDHHSTHMIVEGNCDSTDTLHCQYRREYTAGMILTKAVG